MARPGAGRDGGEPTGEGGLAGRRSLVTGVAGFIGSHLAESILDAGGEVIGVDCFTDYYARSVKERNLAGLRRHSRFRFVEQDLHLVDLRQLVDGIDFVFHQAGQAGVRASWDSSFHEYTTNNILATQRLLQAVRRVPIKAFVFASSSSIYGNASELPTRETTLPAPVSPYGVTKLAAEHLCRLYAEAFSIPSICLRYFTVYGPRQRPDMAFHRLISAVLDGAAFELYGDGDQTRDFTYVADIVRANLAAAGAGVVAQGRVFNIGGGNRATMNAVIQLLERITGGPVKLLRRPAQPGDARHTYADCSAAQVALGFRPEWTLEAGLQAQVSSLRKGKAA